MAFGLRRLLGYNGQMISVGDAKSDCRGDGGNLIANCKIFWGILGMVLLGTSDSQLSLPYSVGFGYGFMSRREVWIQR